jgi:hypothetical protein
MLVDGSLFDSKAGNVAAMVAMQGVIPLSSVLGSACTEDTEGGRLGSYQEGLGEDGGRGAGSSGGRKCELICVETLLQETLIGVLDRK